MRIILLIALVVAGALYFSRQKAETRKDEHMAQAAQVFRPLTEAEKQELAQYRAGKGDPGALPPERADYRAVLTAGEIRLEDAAGITRQLNGCRWQGFADKTDPKSLGIVVDPRCNPNARKTLNTQFTEARFRGMAGFIRITNTGNAPAYGVKAQAQGDYMLDAGGCKPILQPWESCSLLMGSRPGPARRLSGGVTVTATRGGTATIQLQGMASQSDKPY